VIGLHRFLRPIALGALALVGAVALTAVGLVRSGPAGAGGGVPPRSSFSLGEARAFDEFPLYSAGADVDGLPLTAVLRRDGTASFVSFVYGDCVASGDSGCAPPAEVQLWP
jgi:hypothetical protein